MSGAHAATMLPAAPSPTAKNGDSVDPSGHFFSTRGCEHRLAARWLGRLARRVRIPDRQEDTMTRQLVVSAVVAALVAGVGLTGCEKGPLQEAGEKIDKATGEDRLIGSGPAEKAGRKIDNTVDDIKK